MSDTFLYFAYGSNMPTLRITDEVRCPSAEFAGVGALKGYELRWHKPSRDESGKCDVVRSLDAESSVLGVLYRINQSDKAALDKEEAGYNAISMDIITDGNVGPALVYVARKQDKNRRPYTWYKELVLLGAIQHGLPDAYLEGIKSVAADVDPNPNRRLEKEALVERVRLDVSSRSTSSGSNFS